MAKREVRTMQNKVHRLAKGTCANHTGEDGCRETIHGKCVLSFNADRVTGNVCPYFMKSVGPSEPGLFHEYLEHFPTGYPLKPDKTEFPDKCEKCFQRYKRTSNRQKYCERCRDDVKREQSKARMKEKRRKKS